MSPRRHLMIRSVALILLCMAGYIAWTRNFGEGIKGVPALALVSAAVSFAFEWIDHSQSDRIKKVFTHSLLAWPVLVAGYVVLAVLLSLNAPVTVLNAGDQALPVSLTPLDQANAKSESATSSKDGP